MRVVQYLFRGVFEGAEHWRRPNANFQKARKKIETGHYMHDRDMTNAPR
jgi:hypothetical protein